MPTMKKHLGSIVSVINLIVLVGGLFYTNGRQVEKITIIESKIVSCEEKMQKMDDLIRRLEISIVKMEAISGKKK